MIIYHLQHRKTKIHHRYVKVKNGHVNVNNKIIKTEDISKDFKILNINRTGASEIEVIETTKSF
jgi:hypothetical protein